MRTIPALLALFALAAPLGGQETVRTPAEIVAAAPAADWTTIAPDDLLVMDLAADGRGPSTGSGERRVVIQLMPPPFSQGWVGNVRKLALAHWWDGLSVYRVQDNYVAQWGDASEKKALPDGLAVVPQSDYFSRTANLFQTVVDGANPKPAHDPYAPFSGLRAGWPIAYDNEGQWPVHCYAMVGVARNPPPDTGTGAELYVVIGHAPRQLDRNIALVGRVIEGIEHLSSLPRGTAPMGVYATPEERVPIRSVRLGNEVAGLAGYQYLSTESASFARYADARANRRDAFFVRPAGGADVCNIPVPVRRVPAK